MNTIHRMTTTTMTTRMMTTAESPSAEAILSYRCPACGRSAFLHTESAQHGTEVVCTECSAILRVERTAPLTLSELNEEDLP